MWMICVVSFQMNQQGKKNRFSLDLLDVIWCLVSASNHEFLYFRTKTEPTVEGRRVEKKPVSYVLSLFFSSWCFLCRSVCIFERGNKQIC